MTNYITNKKVCCEWHDHLPDMYQMETTSDECYGECGLAGKGTPNVCCDKCPAYDWFVKHRGVMPNLVKNIMALPLEKRP